MRKYGLPYKGSKAAIAEWVVACIPAADVLVDAFCGGCAVTHAAMISGKWSKIIANDVAGDVPQLFVDAINGKFKNERSWISREDFFRLKDADPYIRCCWSFGNDCKSYIYGREVEPFKKCVHELVFADTPSERMTAFRKIIRMLRKDVENPACNTDTVQRLEKLRRQQSLQGLERLQTLESLQSLQGLQRLEVSSVDYRDLKIPTNAVIYCDPPYECTDVNYGCTFNKQEFLEWAISQTVPVIVSEYNISDDRFGILAETQKKQLSGGAVYAKTVTERLYVPKNQLEDVRQALKSETAEQLMIHL